MAWKLVEGQPRPTGSVLQVGAVWGDPHHVRGWVAFRFAEQSDVTAFHGRGQWNYVQHFSGIWKSRNALLYTVFTEEGRTTVQHSTVLAHTMQEAAHIDISRASAVCHAHFAFWTYGSKTKAVEIAKILTFARENDGLQGPNIADETEPHTRYDNSPLFSVEFETWEQDD